MRYGGHFVVASGLGTVGVLLIEVVEKQGSDVVRGDLALDGGNVDAAGYLEDIFQGLYVDAHDAVNVDAASFLEHLNHPLRRHGEITGRVDRLPDARWFEGPKYRASGG